MGDLVSVHIKPTTSTTTYNFKIEDPDGLEVYETIPVKTGELADSYDAEIVNEVLTCKLSIASRNEVFTVIIRTRLDIQSR